MFCNFVMNKRNTGASSKNHYSAQYFQSIKLDMLQSLSIKLIQCNCVTLVYCCWTVLDQLLWLLFGVNSLHRTKIYISKISYCSCRDERGERLKSGISIRLRWMNFQSIRSGTTRLHWDFFSFVRGKLFLWYLALDVTANCICKIHCLALNGLDLKTVHNLSSKEEKSWQSQDLNQCRWVGIKIASFVLPPVPLTSFSLEEEPEKAGNSPNVTLL